MHFQLSSIPHLLSDAGSVIGLFLTIDGKTHHLAFNHDAFTPENIKDTLVTAVTNLADMYLSTKQGE